MAFRLNKSIPKLQFLFPNLCREQERAIKSKLSPNNSTVKNFLTSIEPDLRYRKDLSNARIFTCVLYSWKTVLYVIEVTVLHLAGEGGYSRSAEITCRKVYSCSGWKMTCCPLTEHKK